MCPSDLMLSLEGLDAEHGGLIYFQGVVVKQGTKDAVVVDGAEAGEANNWVQPDDDRVIAHTKLLNPGESEEIKFKGQIAGFYEFVCAFPGHSATMFGEFKFLQSGQR